MLNPKDLFSFQAITRCGIIGRKGLSRVEEIRILRGSEPGRKPLRHHLFFGTLFVLAFLFTIAFYGAVGMALMWIIKHL